MAKKNFLRALSKLYLFVFCYFNWYKLYEIIFSAVGFFLLVAGMILAVGSIKANRHFHMILLINILQSPMHFFDSTPSGRILNRFSKDIDSIDLRIPDTLRKTVLGILNVISTILLIVIVTPLSLVAIVPLLVLYGLVQVCGVLHFYISKRLYLVTEWYNPDIFVYYPQHVI